MHVDHKTTDQFTMLFIHRQCKHRIISKTWSMTLTFQLWSV